MSIIPEKYQSIDFNFFQLPDSIYESTSPLFKAGHGLGIGLLCIGIIILSLSIFLCMGAAFIGVKNVPEFLPKMFLVALCSLGGGSILVALARIIENGYRAMGRYLWHRQNHKIANVTKVIN